MSTEVRYDPLSHLVIRRPMPTLIRGNTCLLTIDMDHGDVHPEYGIGKLARDKGLFHEMAWYYDEVKRITPNICMLQDTARASGVEVVHCKWAELTEDSRDASRRCRSRGIFQHKSSKEAEIIAEVGPIGDEMVFSKSTSSAFLGTNIDRVLTWMGIDTIIAVGVVTNGCVELTVRVATDIGYSVILVSDACAAHTPFLHDNAIRRMDDGYIHIALTEDILRALANVRGSVETT